MISDRHFAHLNVARLRARAGDPLVAEFIDNVPKVNAVAERSPGFVWRLDDSSAQVSSEIRFQAVTEDPLIAASLSVWESVEALEFFVRKTIHGGFVRRRDAWFEPWGGPSYVVWPVGVGHLPSMAEGLARLDALTRNGASVEAFDFHWYGAKTAGAGAGR